MIYETKKLMHQKQGCMLKETMLSIMNARRPMLSTRFLNMNSFCLFILHIILHVKRMIMFFYFSMYNLISRRISCNWLSSRVSYVICLLTCGWGSLVVLYQSMVSLHDFVQGSVEKESYTWPSLCYILRSSLNQGLVDFCSYDEIESCRSSAFQTDPLFSLVVLALQMLLFFSNSSL